MRLLLYERNITAEDYLAENLLTHDEEPYILADDLEDLRFEYLGDGENETDLDWAAYWQPVTATDLPRAVRILSRQGTARSQVRVISRVRLWSRSRIQ